MKCIIIHSLFLFKATLIVILFCISNQAFAEDEIEFIKKGIVKISVQGTGDNIETGAGIIIGSDSQKVYILTAWHNFVGEGEEVSQKGINVHFFKAGQNPIAGDIYPSVDDDLDLAVITVDMKHASEFSVEPYLEIGRVDKMKNLDQVIAVGHPGVMQWISSSGEIFMIDHLRINFSGTIKPGYSGGPLLNSKNHLIGIVTHLSPESGIAVRIDIALDKLQQWNVPVQLPMAKSSRKWWFIAGIGGAAAIAVTAVLLPDNNNSTGNGQSDVLPFPPMFR